MKKCGDNMVILRNALRDYADERDGQLPPASDWCDVLIKEEGISPQVFVCQNSNTKLGQSSYALNKNVVGMKFRHIPHNTVVLFEATPGWNQVGGPELVTGENHTVLSSEMFNVIFIVGRVEHHYKDQLNKLQWKP